MILYSIFLKINSSLVASGITNLNSIQLNSLKKGSVIVDSTLGFQSNSPSANTNSFVNSVRNAIVANTNDPNIPIIPSSVIVSIGNL